VQSTVPFVEVETEVAQEFSCAPSGLDQSRETPPLVQDLGSLSGFSVSALLRVSRDLFTRNSSLEGERSRSATRYRRAALSAATSLFSKAIVLVTTIVSVPLTFRYLGAERYGLWMTITSSVLFIGFADFGVGNGLTAAIAQCHGKDDEQRALQQVSCGFYLLALIALVLCALILPALHFVPWNMLYGTKTALASHEAGPATAILILCIALSMPLGTVLRVQTGYQQGYAGDLWNAAGNALALVGIIVVTRFGGGLPILVCAVAGAPVLATTANWLNEFFRVRPFLRPRLSLFDRRVALHLASVGSLFFAQQCFGLLYYVSDNFVIARTMGAASVAQYAVMQRIFSAGLLAQYFMTPLWPAITEALARRDLKWAHRVIRRAMVLSVGLGLLCAAFLLAVSRYLMRRWAGVDVGTIDLLRVGFAVWVVLVGYVAAMNAILNQPGLMRRHLMWFGGASLTSLALKIAFARHGSLAGVIWSTVIGFAVVYVVPSARLALHHVGDVAEVTP
jgi:O-antigen/teichoic acid export membrane protein